jgi:hypothetical protein
MHDPQREKNPHEISLVPLRKLPNNRNKFMTTLEEITDKNREEKLARLRVLWKYAPKEERYAINVTGMAMIDGRDPETVLRRSAAHERRFSKNRYDV